MKHRQFVRSCFAGLVILLVMIASAPMMGQEGTITPLRPEPTDLPGGYPQYDDVYINDFAGILSPTTEESLRQDLITLWDSGIETTIVTMDSYKDYATNAASFEAFATNLFNLWGVGDTDFDGVMILVGVEDRKVRIEVGTSYENTMNRTMQGVINEFMLPRFRQNDYEQGIVDGTAAVIRALTGETVFTATAIPTRRPSNTVSTTRSPGSSSTDGAGIAALGAGAVGIGGLGFAAFRRYTRFRPRNCPNCNQPMMRLDEIADDDFLDDGQRREEALQSVDYDVWKCQSCSTHQVFAYGAMMSGYRECTQCHYRTMGTHSRVIDNADCYSSGLREVTVSCDNCAYHNVYQETIPRKNCDDNNNSSSSFGSSRSSSSRSRKSSFGGGKSSGGGASGSW